MPEDEELDLEGQSISTGQQQVELLRDLLACCRSLVDGLEASNQAVLDALAQIDSDIVTGDATIADLLNQILQGLSPVPGPATNVTVTWRQPQAKP